MSKSARLYAGCLGFGCLCAALVACGGRTEGDAIGENPQSSPDSGGSAGTGATTGQAGTGGTGAAAGSANPGQGGSAGQGQAGDPGDAGGEDAGDSGGDPVPTGPTTCATFHPGYNTGFNVDGLLRSFYLDLPVDVATGAPLPVVFMWHALGGTAVSQHNFLSQYVDGPDFKFIAISPEKSDYTLMGIPLDWDAVDVTDAVNNREARLFDEILNCLQQRYPVDSNHIHTMGMSFGGIVSDLLGTIRGDEIASIISFSGAYFSDKTNQAAVPSPYNAFFTWPAPAHHNDYAQLIFSGGPNDKVYLPIAKVGPLVLNFDQFATNDTPYLNGLGHDVIKCEHNNGHTMPPNFSFQGMAEFFKAHPKGVAISPFRTTGLPSDYPATCALRVAN